MAGERIVGACWCLEEGILGIALEMAYPKESMIVTLVCNDASKIDY